MTYLCYHRELWSSPSRPTFWYRLRGTAASFPGPAAWSMWSCWRWKETGRLIHPPEFSRGEVLSFSNSWLDKPTRDCLNQQHHLVWWTEIYMHSRLCRVQPWAKLWDRYLVSSYFVLHHPSLPVGSQESGKIFNSHLNSLLNKIWGAWTCYPWTFNQRTANIFIQKRHQGLHHVCLCWDEMGLLGPPWALRGECMSKSISLKRKIITPRAHILRKEEKLIPPPNKQNIQADRVGLDSISAKKLPNVCSEEPGSSTCLLRASVF